MAAAIGVDGDCRGPGLVAWRADEQEQPLSRRIERKDGVAVARADRDFLGGRFRVDPDAMALQMSSLVSASTSLSVGGRLSSSQS